MANLLGRPAIEAEAITLRLNDPCMDLLNDGTPLLAKLTGTSANRSAWLRSLIDFTFTGTAVVQSITADRFMKAFPPTWFEIPVHHKVTARLTDPQRILLRRFECHIQSFDWARGLYRNEAALTLIAEFGPLYNRSLQVKLSQASST